MVHIQEHNCWLFSNKAHELDLQFCVDAEDAFSRGTWRHTSSTSLWMKKRRSAALHAGGETRAVCEEQASRYLHHLSRSLRTDLELRYRSGQHEVLALVFFCFVSFPLPPHYGWPSFTLQRLNRGWEPIRPQRCFATEKRARSEKPQIYRAFFQAADVLQPLHRFYMVSIPCVCPAVYCEMRI